MIFLLDTNAWIEILNKPQGKVAKKLASHSPHEIALCSVVLGELLVGVYKSLKQKANYGLVHQLMDQFTCLPFDEAAADHFAQVRSHLELHGKPIGPYDSQIAGIALAHGLIVVTGNVAEFSRVPRLLVENWH